MSNCKVVLRGVKEGHSVDDVVEALARYSKKPPERLRAILLSGKDAVAKRTPDAQQAMKYKKMLDEIGCRCVVEAEITGTSSSVESMTSSLTNLTEGASASPSVQREYQYASTPLSVRLKMLRLPILLAVALALGYFAWLRLR